MFPGISISHSGMFTLTCSPLRGYTGAQHLSTPGCSWMSLDVAGCSWMSLDLLGCPWMFLEVPVCLWMFLDVPGCSWISLEDPKCCCKLAASLHIRIMKLGMLQTLLKQRLTLPQACSKF